MAVGSIASVSLDELSELFEKAAQFIDEKGWWKPGLGGENEHNSSACIMNAITYIASQSDALNRAAQEVVMSHFGKDELAEVFDLNDAQPEDSGKEWAVSNLREIANNVRSSQRDSAAL